jgi:deoxyadenosine/deoxycytidine kinase
MKKNPLASARHIVVEGPIGVGKTSLARRLAGHLEAQLLLEQPELNPFLSRFYQDQRRFALQTQLFFLFQRLDQLRELSQPDFFTRTVVADYLLEKDPLFALLTLSEDEYTLYRKIYDHISPQTASPDLVIYLQARCLPDCSRRKLYTVLSQLRRGARDGRQLGESQLRR